MLDSWDKVGDLSAQRKNHVAVAIPTDIDLGCKKGQFSRDEYMAFKSV